MSDRTGDGRAVSLAKHPGTGWAATFLAVVTAGFQTWDARDARHNEHELRMQQETNAIEIRQKVETKAANHLATFEKWARCDAQLAVCVAGREAHIERAAEAGEPEPEPVAAATIEAVEETPPDIEAEAERTKASLDEIVDLLNFEQGVATPEE